MKNLAQLREEIYLLINADDKDKKRFEKPVIHAINYALSELCGEVSPIVSHMKVNILREENLLGNITLPILVGSGQKKVFPQKKAGSIALKYVGQGEMTVTRKGIPENYSLEYSPVEKEFKVRFDEALTTLVEIHTDKKIMITSFAMYHTTDEPVCDEEFVYFDMDELTDRKFMRFYTENPATDLLTSEMPLVRYKNTHTVGIKNKDGIYEINYLRYPELLPENAGGNEIIDVSEEASPLIPLLCAWRLLKEDDERLATMYYNEYVSARDNLIMIDRINRITELDVKGGIL